VTHRGPCQPPPSCDSVMLGRARCFSQASRNGRWGWRGGFCRRRGWAAQGEHRAGGTGAWPAPQVGTRRCAVGQGRRADVPGIPKPDTKRRTACVGRELANSLTEREDRFPPFRWLPGVAARWEKVAGIAAGCAPSPGLQPVPQLSPRAGHPASRWAPSPPQPNHLSVCPRSYSSAASPLGFHTDFSGK